MNRILLVLLAALTLGSAGFGIAQLNEVQKLKDNLSALDQDRLALQKRLWDLQKRNNELRSRSTGTADAATAGSATDASGDAGAAVAGGPRFGRGDRGGDFGRFNALMANPEVQKLMAVQQKAGLDSHYASLFKALQLSPADLEKFKNLLVEKQSSVMDVMAAARAQGLDPRTNRDEVRQLVQDAQNDVDANIRTTLGDAAYAQYQNFEATLPQRNTVTQLSQRLSYSADPLSDAQSQQLVQILADSSPTSGANSNRALASAVRSITGGGGPSGGGAPITDAAIAQAQSVLSAQQLSALQSLQQEQQASAKLMQQMRNRTPGPVTTVTVDAAPAVHP